MSADRLTAARRAAAKKLGISLEEYLKHLAASEKWCCACKAWHGRAAFHISRTKSDGLKTVCKQAQYRYARASNSAAEKRRDPAKVSARARVRSYVRSGRLPRAGELACNDCGHKGSDRRHEYDHYKGYAREHWLSVQPVCAKCHVKRHRVGVQDG